MGNLLPVQQFTQVDIHGVNRYDKTNFDTAKMLIASEGSFHSEVQQSTTVVCEETTEKVKPMVQK